MTSSYLLFLLSNRLFGVRLAGAIEILPWRACRSVPLSYSYVEGLLDYRGVIYPVYNLVQRLGIGAQAAQETPGRSIILLEEKNKPFGIVVDSVVKMTKLEEQAAAPQKVEGVDARYVRGIVTEDSREAMILDFERLFHAG